MHMTVITNVNSTYMLLICDQSMIIWHMVFFPVGLSMVSSLVRYVWMILMHSGSVTSIDIFVLRKYQRR
jgi:hypothetical protein